MATNKKRNNKKGNQNIKKVLLKTDADYAAILERGLIGREMDFYLHGIKRIGKVTNIEFDGVHTNIELKNVRVVR